MEKRFLYKFYSAHL